MHCLNFRSVFAGPLFISFFVFSCPTLQFLFCLSSESLDRFRNVRDSEVSNCPNTCSNCFTKAWFNQLQELIDAAAYVPPPPSQEKLKRINRLARVENEKRLLDKKRAGSKKSERRNKGSWD
jgi:hypothetical protein